jgi:hypothetical protein
VQRRSWLRCCINARPFSTERLLCAVTLAAVWIHRSVWLPVQRFFRGFGLRVLAAVALDFDLDQLAISKVRPFTRGLLVI